jgi:hypothetical protein
LRRLKGAKHENFEYVLVICIGQVNAKKKNGEGSYEVSIKDQVKVHGQ